ncbi:MAG TPA: hypothetical protein VH143_05890 [Kofleriaceae bacterium]|nr:hypothetical protein [Kofleriaceae bacterium]
MTKLLACLLLVAASGCPNVSADQGEGQGQLPTTDGPTVEFDPANSIIPFPNNLALDPTTGKVAVPAPACESPVSAALRTGVLNTLDGFGTYEAAMQVTFTDTIDVSSLAGKIVMYERMKGSTSLDPSSATPIPLKVVPGTALRFDASDCASPASVNAVTIVPEVPLDEKSTYTLAVLSGVQTSAGSAYLPSFTWALVRQSVDPVTIDSSGNIISNSTPLDPSNADQAQQIVAIDGLWKAEATGLAFLDGTGAVTDRSDVLVGWEITTQTTTDPLDPTVVNSVASSLTTGSLLGTASIVWTGVGQNSSCPSGPDCGVLPPQADVQGVIEALLVQGGIASSATTAPAICQALHLCGATSSTGPIGDVIEAALPINNYQQHVTNTLANGVDLPGAWSDPLSPQPEPGFVTSLNLPPTPGLVEVFGFVPSGTAPAAGWPTVIFGHGLGSKKETLILLAGALATQGIASVAIDFVNSGSRAIRISDDPMLGCGPGTCSNNTNQTCYADTPLEGTCTTGGTCILATTTTPGAPSYSVTPQCYAPFLSTDLAGTRDNMRQTILDLQRLVLAMKGCGSTIPNACGDLAVDSTKLLYTGISLGGIIGSTVTSIQPDLVGGVLNVPGVGWLDILENSQTNEIKCPLVDALISAGVLTGDQWNGMDGAAGTGLCTTNAWLMQPAYQQFSQAARWILDPADGANFVPGRLAAKKFLIEEVVNDQVVPNVATNNEGALVGQTPVNADPLTPLTQQGNVQPDLFDPSMALQSAPTTNHWLQYPTVAAGTDMTDPWGIAYQHASLLEPVTGLSGQCAAAPATACTDDTACGANAPCVFPGQLGTARLQADAAYFLKSNE